MTQPRQIHLPSRSRDADSDTRGSWTRKRAEAARERELFGAERGYGWEV